jgi:hypothetical protein
MSFMDFKDMFFFIGTYSRNPKKAENFWHYVTMQKNIKHLISSALTE